MKAILLFVLFGMVPVAAAKVFYSATPKIYLSMVNSSVDDKYSNCTKEMSEKVHSEYFPKEEKDKSFATVWKRAEKCRNKSVQIRPPQDAALTEKHLQAICLYTAGGPANFYKGFNEFVRTNKSVYNTTFPYHAMHFWLTTAIQILQANNKTCHFTYRRTTVNFSGDVNQKMRFGSFTSSSFKTDQYNFGKETCFYIKTCSGAFLKNYTTMGAEEQEVLIPPYEVFNITEKTEQSYKGLSDCSKIFVLESAGDISDLDCTVAF